MAETTTKTKNIVWWDGKHESFEYWSLKFESMAMKENFEDAYEIDEEKDLPGIPEANATEAEKEKFKKEMKTWRELNAKGYHELLQSIKHTTKEGQSALQTIRNCKTEYFNKSATEAMTKLKKGMIERMSIHQLNLKRSIQLWS